MKTTYNVYAVVNGRVYHFATASTLKRAKNFKTFLESKDYIERAMIRYFDRNGTPKRA